MVQRALAECVCGSTKCPTRDPSPSLMTAAAEAWLLKEGFAERRFRSLICPRCRTSIFIRIVREEDQVENDGGAE